MKRATSVEALMRKAKADFVELQTAYESSLQNKYVSEDLKVTIKNIFENLRSCLDYIAQDIFETHCSTSKKPDRLYFPIRATSKEFIQAISRDYPNLQTTASNVYDIIEAIQPYHDPWLGQFNKFNNRNKHQDLIEQSRTEARHVSVSGDAGSVSWGPGVKFGSGVRVMGVSIDPGIQIPITNDDVKTKVVIWVEFRFREIDQPVITFIEASLSYVEKLFYQLRPYI